MRVAHLACVAPPQIGGIGTAAYREVIGLRARGVDAALIAPSLVELAAAHDERSFIERVSPFVRWGNAAIMSWNHPRLRDADLIHLHYPFFGTAEKMIWHVPRVPIVCTFHMDAVADGWKGRVFALSQHLTQPLILRRMAAVVVSSFDYARHSSLQSFFIHHPERVHEIPFGLDTDFFSPGVGARARFSIPTDGRMILFVGGLDQAHRFKGLSLLLRAMRSLDPMVHLVVASDGPLRAEYEREVHERRLSSRVHFMGRVDPVTLRDAYRIADLLACPSINQAEAFGLVALEASACGTPVVASALPGVRTVVRHGETGLLVTPAHEESLVAGLEMMLKDEGLRARCAVAARAWALERFSWDRHLDALQAVYSQVCASPS